MTTLLFAPVETRPVSPATIPETATLAELKRIKASWIQAARDLGYPENIWQVVHWLGSQTRTGLILLSDRSSSSYGDEIPDAWRLRYFGTVNNILSLAAANADGDGANNWQEYVAGTDPTDPNSVLRVSTGQAVAETSQDCVVQWPSVAGKSYIIERSASVFGPNWIPVSTNTGSGTDMVFHDSSGGAVRFYRVRVDP